MKNDNETLKILWVDDEEMMRSIGREYVEAFGHTIDTAKSGEEALVKLSDNNFDLLITDIGMPKMNGWQLVENVRNGSSNKILIAIVTGWGTEIDNELKDQLKIDFVLGKPVGIDQISDLIDNVLEIKKNSL